MQRKNKRAPAQMRAKTAARKSKPKARPSVKSSREKVRAYRERMRAKGLRLVQLWVPNTRNPEAAAEAPRRSQRPRRAGSAAIRKAWAQALSPMPAGHVPSYADIAHLVGSVDGLPSDLSTRKKYYLKLYGYGRNRSR